MSAWKSVPLYEVATIERNAVGAAEIENGTTYVGLENIETGGKFVGVREVDKGELASNKFAFTDRHVLYGKLRPYLAKIARPSFGGICSTDILPVLAGKKLDRNYLAHFLLQPAMVDFANSRAAGANLPRLSPRVLAEFQIPLPPIQEQRRIAEVLDQAEALRAKRRAALAQLDSLTQSIFIDMFGDPTINPKQWPRKDLGSLVIEGFQNGLYKPASKYGTGTPILRIDAFYDGAVTRLRSLKRLKVSSAELETYGLCEGDVVINRVNSMEYLGKSAIIPALPEPVVFESNMMRFRVNRQIVLPSYVVAFLQSRFIKGQIGAAAKQAVNQASINQKDVSGLRINVPPLPLQQTFAHRITAIEALKTTHRAALAELDALFASLQHRAFRGEL